MVKFNYKLIISVLLVLILLFSINLNYQNSKALTLDEVFKGANDFIDNGDGGNKIDDDNLKELSNSLYNILLVIGVVVATIIGSILGIQFITGSIEQKSKVKESLIPYTVGCVVIFSAFGIWKLVVTILAKVA